MKKNIFFMLLLSVMFFMSSCSHRITDFTIISTRNVPIGQNAVSLEKADARVKGKDSAFSLLFLQFGRPDMKEAIDKALDKHNGAVALVDGVVKSKWWSLILFGKTSIVVEGTPIYEAKEVQEK